MKKLIDELNRRWNAIFTALASGDNPTPAQRLRAEGMMESLVLSGEVDSEQLDEAMDQCYKTVFGRCISEDFDADWRAFFPFPQIPGHGQRAPVYPSTKD